jgi:uncharacterized protein (DUF1330 family)
MSKGYWIARVDVHDQEAYKGYLARNGKAFAKYGARFVVRGGPFEVGAGTARERNVVIEFPSYEAAMECLRSPEYAEAAAYRDRGAHVDLIVIGGYEGPQPGEA